MRRTTKEEKLEKKRNWYYKNIDKVKAQAKKSREKHKEQRKLDNKNWVEKNKEYLKQYRKEYHKKYYQDNKEKIDKKNRSWALKNPEQSVKIVQKYNRSHTEEVKERAKDYIKKLTGRYRGLKGNAQSRNYTVTFTLEEFSKIVSNSCSYCGENEKRIGIDRIDNTKGYTIENSTSCCKICNMMKKTMTVDEFISHTKKIHNHFINLNEKNYVSNINTKSKT